ncbi:AP2/ERF domain-containing protein [Psidium guajava]|nr:AP2/ERF domain-containing protein [Psidium guajava]
MFLPPIFHQTAAHLVVLICNSLGSGEIAPSNGTRRSSSAKRRAPPSDAIRWGVHLYEHSSSLLMRSGEGRKSWRSRMEAWHGAFGVSTAESPAGIEVTCER